MRRIIVGLIAAALVLSFVPRAASTPVATDETTYQAYGRVFPDPHGCRTAAPGNGNSPFAKGKVCGVDFIQLEELHQGVALLEELFPSYIETYLLHEDFDCSGKPVRDQTEGCKAFRSAGLPVSASDGGAMTRERLPLPMVRVTDESVPNDGKRYFVFPLSIHGIERAGAEGGTRAIEDLATWAACEAGKAPDITDCEAEGEIPHPLMEATPEGSITAGEALRKSVIYFIYPNPDGWYRGDRTTGTQFYQRYNGNGVDLNRDWPEQGLTFRPYTPWSEPESRAFGRVLQAIGPHDGDGDPKWTGGIDLHGQLVDRAFSFTLLGGTQRPYNKDQRILQTVKGAWRDAEARLSWSPIIKPNDAPPTDPRVYGVQWGTIWDTIDYTVTGALGNWIDSPIGLNADGIDNEMSMSHLSNCGVGSCFEPDIEQLHIDGNKSLIYSMIHYSMKPEQTTFETEGRVAYLHNPDVLSAPTDPYKPPPAFTKLPSQDDIGDILLTPENDYTFEFDVEGPKDGVYNGGIEATLNCANVQGTGACVASEARLERKKPEEPTVQGEDWEVVNSYFGSQAGYFQAGMALHANLPIPGRYRVRIAGARETSGVYTGNIRFTKEKAWPDPGQIGYRVTNMNFWKDLKPYTQPTISKITEEDVRGGDIGRYDTIVITNKVYPKLAKPLRSWVKAGGNLVLTDEALEMLVRMRLVSGVGEPDDQADDFDPVDKVGVYAGHVNFMTATEEVTYEHPLARKINQPGAAEGANHRHQTYEPVPLGYELGNAAPAWFVDLRAWDAAAGPEDAVGTTESTDRVSLGEIALGNGRVRIIGSLLPMPTQMYDHPFGLGNYALTFSGYQLLQNLVSYTRP